MKSVTNDIRLFIYFDCLTSKQQKQLNEILYKNGLSLPLLEYLPMGEFKKVTKRTEAIDAMNKLKRNCVRLVG